MSVPEAVSFVAALFSIALSIFAIWLARDFRDEARESERQTRAATEELARSVERIEALLDRFYNDTFGLFADTVGAFVPGETRMAPAGDGDERESGRSRGEASTEGEVGQRTDGAGEPDDGSDGVRSDRTPKFDYSEADKQFVVDYVSSYWENTDQNDLPTVRELVSAARGVGISAEAALGAVRGAVQERELFSVGGGVGSSTELAPSSETALRRAVEQREKVLDEAGETQLPF